MTVHLHRSALTHARNLIRQGKVVRDERDAWREYGKWHLGVDDQENEETKARYRFPYGDFSKVHRCGVISAESRAGQYKYLDVERAATQLLRLIDARRTVRAPARKRATRRKRATSSRK